jgi:hypothetical protein
VGYDGDEFGFVLVRLLERFAQVGDFLLHPHDKSRKIVKVGERQVEDIFGPTGDED